MFYLISEELVPILNERAGFPPDTELDLYEEIKPNMVERIENHNEPLEKVSFSNFFHITKLLVKVNYNYCFFNQINHLHYKIISTNILIYQFC